MKRIISGVMVSLLLSLFTAACCFAVVDEVPNYKILTFPAYFPKNGQNSMATNMMPGDIRNIMNSTYKNWFREMSYYLSNPTNGMPVRGMTVDPKVYGEVAMQWPQNPSAGVNIATNLNLGATSVGQTIYNGTIPSSMLASAGAVFSFGGTVVSDPTGTGLLTGGGGGSINYANGSYSITLTAPSAAVSPVTVAFTIAGANGASPANTVYINPPGFIEIRTWPDSRGEFNNEQDFRGKPHQRYGGDGPLLDGFWTPGERFEDVIWNSTNLTFDTKYDKLIPDETRWMASNTNASYGITTNIYNRDASPLATVLQKEDPTTWSATRGEFYADFENKTVLNATSTKVWSVSFTNDARIWVADTVAGSNVEYHISDLVVVPPNYYEASGAFVVPNNAKDGGGLDIREGDMLHIATNGRPLGAVNIPTNGVFDYNVDKSYHPLVYPAYSVVDGTSNRQYAVYRTYLNLPLSYVAPVSQIVFQVATTASNKRTDPNDLSFKGPYNAATNKEIGEISVPIYQAGELWGDPSKTIVKDGNFLHRDYVTNTPDNIDPYVRLEYDNLWSPGRPAELFEDFISWWDPFGGDTINSGAWFDGVSGCTNAGAPAIIWMHIKGKNNPNHVIAWADYTNYIWQNYPGNAAAKSTLCARSGNGAYDGPDDWVEAINNKMIQNGYSLPLCMAAEPGAYGSSGWDCYSNTTWDVWWTQKYGTPAPAWDSLMPGVVAWVPPTAPTSTPAGTFLGTNYIPLIGSTWGYDGPREFADLPSSMYHAFGDLRLGEETDPWTYSYLGVDKGMNNLGAANPGKEVDFEIPSAGPLAWNIHGTHTLDAGNQLSLELLTRRTDGTSLTGPRSTDAYKASALATVACHEDHRDLNLDGLIDQGETYPAKSYNYSVDGDSLTVNNGMGTWYPFTWTRVMEDVVEANDEFEDFAAIVSNNTSVAGLERKIFAPSGFQWVDGIPSVVPYLSNVVMHQNGAAHPSIDPATDDVWLDNIANGVFDMEPMLNTNGISSLGLNVTALTNKTMGLSIPNAVSYPYTGNPLTDFSWADKAGGIAGVFDTDVVLGDSYELLYNGEVGKKMNWTEPVVVCCEDVDGDKVPTALDNYWIEGLHGSTTTVANAYDADGTDHVIWQGPVKPLANGALREMDAGLLAAVAKMRYFHRAFGSDSGWTSGDDVWIGNGGDIFHSEEPINRPFSLTFLETMTNWVPIVSSNIAAGYLPVNVIPDNSYKWKYDPAWLDVPAPGTALGRYDMDSIIIDNGGVSNGTVGTALAPVAWFHQPGTNGQYQTEYQPPVKVPQAGDIGYFIYGDVLWLDGISNGVFDASSDKHMSVYGVTLYNSTGVTVPGFFKSGNSFSVHTRDKLVLSGGDQVQPAIMPALLSHEQSHDILGWPDLYDYDTYSGEWVNTPIGLFDLMAKGGLVHGTPDLKWSAGLIAPVDLNNTLSNNIITTVKLWPIESVTNQYYRFRNPANQAEWFWFWYGDGSSVYSTMGKGNKGIYIEHSELNGPNSNGHPVGQCIGGRSVMAMVQADGLYQMDDGVNGGTVEDLFGRTVKVFTEATRPAARWFNQVPAGIRIIDIRLPAAENQPAEVDFMKYTSSEVWNTLDAAYMTNSFNFYSDPDGDGLVNGFEQLANTVPTRLSSNVNGIPDFDAGMTNGIGLTYGWRYSDNDWMADDWEMQYPTTCSPLAYDADIDPDGDGWSNFAEFMQRTDPSKASSFPNPAMIFSVNYTGTKRGNIVAKFYPTAAMEGEPMAVYKPNGGGLMGILGESLGITAGSATLSGTLGQVPLYPGQLSITVGGDAFTDNGIGGLIGSAAGSSGTVDYNTGNVTLTWGTAPSPGLAAIAKYVFIDSTLVVYPADVAVTRPIFGHLKEGYAYYHAFIDLNQNNNWDSDEPGYVSPDPVRVSWADVRVPVNLTDSAPGYARFSWYNLGGTNAQADASWKIVVKQINATGQPIVLTRNVKGPGAQWVGGGNRMYFNEGDFLNAGFPNGLPANGVMTPLYQWFVNDVAGGLFTNFWTATIPAPTVVYPIGGVWKFSQVELQWNSAVTNTRFQIEVATGASPAGATLYSLDIATPIRDPDGKYRYTLPYYCGAGAFTNGIYSWRVCSSSPVTNSPWSNYGSFTMDLQPLDGQGGAVKVLTGTVNYYGKVLTNAAAGTIIVEAYKSSGLSGTPTARISLTNFGIPPVTAPFTLLGLPPGNYAVRAYIDQNHNETLDWWESYGFYKDTGNPYSTYYTSAYMPAGGQIIIRDRDTDNDKLPDAWEYSNFGGVTNRYGYFDTNNFLTASGAGPVYGSPGFTDTDGDGLNDYDEYLYGTDANNPDSDGDGINDYLEIMVLGTNPLRADSNGNGISDLAELLSGSLVGGPGGSSGVKIDNLRFDAQGRPIIEWDTHANILGRAVKFVVEGSTDLKTWTSVGVTSASGTAESTSSVTDATSTPASSMFYRLRFYLQ